MQVLISWVHSSRHVLESVDPLSLAPRLDALCERRIPAVAVLDTPERPIVGQVYKLDGRWVWNSDPEEDLTQT